MLQVARFVLHVACRLLHSFYIRSTSRTKLQQVERRFHKKASKSGHFLQVENVQHVEHFLHVACYTSSLIGH